MTSIHHRLLGAPYNPPECREGGELYDVAHGEWCTVGGWSNGRISWPRRLKTGRHSLICTAELARAIQTESVSAITHWWGIGSVTVWKLKKLLGVGRTDPDGTKELYREIMQAKLPPESAAKGRERASSSESIAKMSMSKAGKKFGSPSTQTRAKLSAKKSAWWASKTPGERAEANKKMLSGKRRQ